MTATETGTYIAHHLGIAGRTDTLFSDDATALIHQVSRGLPRAVNNLAIHALISAAADSKKIVDESSARAAAIEITSTRTPGPHQPWPPAAMHAQNACPPPMTPPSPTKVAPYTPLVPPGYRCPGTWLVHDK